MTTSAPTSMLFSNQSYIKLVTLCK